MDVDDETIGHDEGHRVNWFAPDRPVEGTVFVVNDGHDEGAHHDEL